MTPKPVPAVAFLTIAFALAAGAASPVSTYEGSITIPTYEHSAREMEPPLFANSSVAGMYPFTTFLMPYKDGPKAKTYQAVFLENEYLKLTYIPEFGGRFYSIYDKLRKREMLYRNDVVKPAPYNPRNSWPQSGMELTGPHDLHMLTLYGEPFWAHKIVRHGNGSLSLVLGEVDPVYGMNVSFAATLYPGVAAVEISVACYNGNDSRKPQMFWVNTAVAATPKLRFIYPMSRTVGHTTADIADWPVYNGTDYSLDRNNQHMLGVFGIDIYDNFQGAYQFDRDYGVFRFADRRTVQGMKLWTFGYGEGSKTFENGYTDHAGPYVELQSGRHVWDGHYEWVAPHSTESWSEWWIPVSQTGGLTTITQDAALNLSISKDKSSIDLAIAATHQTKGATLDVSARSGTLLKSTIDLDPATAYRKQLSGPKVNGKDLSQLTVTLTGPDGATLLHYVHPDSDPGRQEYTPFTRPLEKPKKLEAEMSAEELVLAAEFRLKELDKKGALSLLQSSLKQDQGNSRASTLWCIVDFETFRYEDAIQRCSGAIERDPYSDTAYYYLAMSQLRLGRFAEAERSFYFIWPESAHFGKREYQLGLLDLRRNEQKAAVKHLKNAVLANGKDLLARLTLALICREDGAPDAARELAAVEDFDPTNRVAAAERWLREPNPARSAEFKRLLGGQTQEAMQTAVFYQRLRRWKDAERILTFAAQENHDPWGTTPEFFYLLAFCQRQLGETSKADASLVKARAAAGHVDRFPFREESLAPLQEAVRLEAKDGTAGFDLACLLYFRGDAKNAIQTWGLAIAANPNDFSSHRALGLALAEQGYPIEQAAKELELAIELNPAHISTLGDLSTLYARAGRFEDQLRILKQAQQRSPADDEVAEAILTSYLSMGQYRDAQELIDKHQFSTHHRSYGLRNEYRVVKYGLGAQSFNKGDYSGALALFQAALNPPVSMSVDTFAGQTSPRIDYYLGRTLEMLSRKEDARASYERAIAGVEKLTGDRDSWNSENFFMVAALDQLGRQIDANMLEQHFTKFAETERDAQNTTHRAEARYLLGLIALRHGQLAEATTLFRDALQARPDLLAARLEMRGDTIQPDLKAKP